jgi:hypothetical protein
MPQSLGLLSFLLLICTQLPLAAQKKGYQPGYIITLERDTIKGQVKDRSPEPFTELYSRIRFIPEGQKSRDKYGSWQVLGYGSGGREYEALPIREESAFFRFRYYLDPGAPKSFLRIIRRDGPLTYYHKEYIHDDNFYLDFIPLIHREGEREMVRVTQGVLGLKRERLMEYFQDCQALVKAVSRKELREPEEVYEFYLENCMPQGSAGAYTDTLEGRWEIDLRPDPDADPYVQEFSVSRVSGNSFEGYFYGSPLEGARLNSNWDELFFAFTTRDQTYAYYHSGYLRDGVLYGVSYCPGREFVQPWTGVRK